MIIYFQAISCVQCGGTGTKCNESVSDKPTACADDSFLKCYTQIGKFYLHLNFKYRKTNGLFCPVISQYNV